MANIILRGLGRRSQQTLVARFSGDTRTMGLCTAASRPFKVLGLQQIAVGGPDKKRLAKLWTDVLGVPCVGTFQSEKENVDEDILALGT